MKTINFRQFEKPTFRLSLRSTGRIIAMFAISSALAIAAAAQCISYDSVLAARSLTRETKETKTTIEKAVDKSDFAAEDAVNPSIVGLWHVKFFVEGNEFQEAFQIYNQGGTEVHNPRVDPRGGSVCLGAWTQTPVRTFKLNHRVWLYDINGNLQAVGHLMETLTLDDRGSTQSGTFTMDIYDPDGNQVGTVSGTVAGERVTAN